MTADWNPNPDALRAMTMHTQVGPSAVTFRDHAELRDHALRMSDALSVVRDHAAREVLTAAQQAAIDGAREARKAIAGRRRELVRPATELAARREAWRRTAGLLPPRPPKGADA